MLLKKLIKNLSSEKKKIKIRGLSNNSKKIKKGFIFFAIRGNKINGEKFINEAVKNGASVVICSQNCNYKNNKILVIKTHDVRKSLSKISANFYKLKPKNIIAVTGTNGKTSVADLFYQILSLNNIPVASIGTFGVKYNGRIKKTDLTSPDTIDLHYTLEKLKKNGVNNVIIEASSHGLHQRRLDNINFKAGIFTNFSQDHLDYHKTMTLYLKAKLLLFSRVLNKKKTIISDKNIKEFSILKRISKKRNLKLLDISLIEERLLKNNFLNLNEFQRKNLSMAIKATKLCNLNEKKIFNSINRIKDVNGRLELIRIFPNNVKVYVDFAHTPDALQKSLNSLRNLYVKNISIVFGCGGDRDFKKRPLMAKAANKNCEKVYVTDDNPRSESPKKIRTDIIKNLKDCEYYNIGNRRKAIERAIKNAEPNEVILVAGKGHEEQQVYKNKILKISDKKIIKGLKNKLKKISLKDQNHNQNKKIIKELHKKIDIKNFHGLSIDSRMVKKNNLFLTIKGKNNDGAKFIPMALKKGARYIVTSNYNQKYKNKIIKVNNVKKFLTSFAIKKRNLSHAKIIAITGSIGKTSLKNILKDLLSNYGETLSSPKSYNNHFGVPLSLSQLDANQKYGVFEVGMSKAGEINSLSKIIKPHIGIITNIGEAHIENFNNQKGIANAKGEIIKNIVKKGMLILNRDDKYFSHLAAKAHKNDLKIISFGLSKKSDVYPISISKGKKVSLIKIKLFDQIISLQVKNMNIYNVLASLILLKKLNLNLEKILKYYKNYEPTEGRGKIHSIKRYKKTFNLIDESYNANPLSVKNAIKNFNAIKKINFKKYLLLGDMLELGKKSVAFHKDLSKVINNSDIDKVFIKGSKTLFTYQNIVRQKRGNIFQHEEDMDFILNKIIANNDYLMIKGSNATGLINLSKRMIKGY